MDDDEEAVYKEGRGAFHAWRNPGLLRKEIHGMERREPEGVRGEGGWQG